MIVLEVLASFRRAAQILSDLEDQSQETQSGRSDSSGQTYHSPSVENCILAPYNFNFS